MGQWSLSSTQRVILSILMVPMIYGASVLMKRAYDFYNRPLFRNEYYGDVCPPLSGWVISSWRLNFPAIDRDGTLCLADCRLNLFLAVIQNEVGSQSSVETHRDVATEIWHSIMLQATREQVRFTVGGKKVVVPRQENAMVIISSEGHMETVAIEPGDACEWFSDLKAGRLDYEEIPQLGKKYRGRMRNMD